MSKVLRLHTSGVDTLEDWQNCAVYGSDVISQIEDPNGATAKHEITSIPSPFARIDLVKQAFKNVVDSKQLDGKTIFHKMVSDSLDIGEIFFKSNTYSDRVKIIFWDKTSNIDALLNGSAKQKILGQTLKMYLDQDAKAYNFDKMQRFFILGYTGDKRKTEFDVLGATSPATLFFSIANDLKYVSNEIPFNTDFPFDDDYNPLVKRDKEFIKYLFALKKSRRDFADLFPEVTAYLDLTYENLDVPTKNEISAMDATSVSNYDSLYTADGNNVVEIISGMTFHAKQKSDNATITSDFSINSTRKPNDKILVLPVEEGSKYSTLTLTQGKWDGNNPAPYKDSAEVLKRRLPQTSEQIPYLAISDFLEDSIIKMPYKLNSQAFFDANTEPQDVSYFLPLKDKFFEYFTTDDIINDRMIEFKKNSGGVKVVLHIPVKGGTIDYERIYFENCEPKIDGRGKTGSNDGGMVSKRAQFAFALMPNVRFEKPEDAHYRFSLVTQMGADNSKYTVDFYNSDFSKIQNVQMSKRNENDRNSATNMVYGIEKNNISYIRISDEKATGILLPKPKIQQSNSNFTFAIDFGTSNTHVVCKSDNAKTGSMEITQTDMQVNVGPTGKNVPVQTIEPIFRELCPETIGEGCLSRFPMRSALSVGRNTNWNKSFFAFGQANYAFLYEKKAVPKYNDVITNLKWSNDSDNVNKIKCFIESLFFVLRNKVVLNDGRLDNVKIIWTYPLSMTLARRDQFKQVWEDAYKKFFSADVDSNLFDINESVAPYYYYKAKQNNVSNIVTIDIGGGTSDIVIANHNEIKCITSFRFASNTLFGDLNENNEGELSGIVSQFANKIESKLKENSLSVIESIYNDLKNKNNSADIASFFFSLKDNKDLTDKKIDIDFSSELQRDTKQKISFLIFYCAIIYHLAKLMKAKQLEMPRHIGFSGNGAKVINILTTNKKLLENLTKQIIERIYQTDYPSDGLSVILMDTPKEATSMGAIMGRRDDYDEINAKKTVLLGTDSDTFADSYKYQDIKNNIDKYIDDVQKEAEKFIKFVFELNDDKLSFRDSFGIDQDVIEQAQKVCNRDIKTYAENRLHQKLDEVNAADKIEETMFFYPLSGVINNLTSEIAKQVINNYNR